VEAVHNPIPDSDHGRNLPLHGHSLFKLGAHLVERWLLWRTRPSVRARIGAYGSCSPRRRCG